LTEYLDPKTTKYQRNGEHFIIRSFKICIKNQILGRLNSECDEWEHRTCIGEDQKTHIILRLKTSMGRRPINR
jgi:hypothetical protein